MIYQPLEHVPITLLWHVFKSDIHPSEKLNGEMMSVTAWVYDEHVAVSTINKSAVFVAEVKMVNTREAAKSEVFIQNCGCLLMASKSQSYKFNL